MTWDEKLEWTDWRFSQFYVEQPPSWDEILTGVSEIDPGLWYVHVTGAGAPQYGQWILDRGTDDKPEYYMLAEQPEVAAPLPEQEVLAVEAPAWVDGLFDAVAEAVEPQAVIMEASVEDHAELMLALQTAGWLS